MCSLLADSWGVWFLPVRGRPGDGIPGPWEPVQPARLLASEPLPAGPGQIFVLSLYQGPPLEIAQQDTGRGYLRCRQYLFFLIEL